jgi:hypothetical protein
MTIVRRRRSGYGITLVIHENGPRVWASITQNRKVVWAGWLTSRAFKKSPELDNPQRIERFITSAFTFAREDGKIPKETTP